MTATFTSEFTSGSDLDRVGITGKRPDNESGQASDNQLVFVSEVFRGERLGLPPSPPARFRNSFSSRVRLH
jgi:hypothetical protein